MSEQLDLSYDPNWRQPVYETPFPLHPEWDKHPESPWNRLDRALKALGTRAIETGGTPQAEKNFANMDWYVT